ncbi:MAG: class I SAM-dependent methyltransferase [Desulfobacterales bacterium]|nr:class I SAM-dependent methyltransferase [Desulfobacterales bacterium]
MFLIKFIPAKILSLQSRKPSGIIGRYLMTKAFNTGNVDLNYFVKETLNIQGKDRILEIGFGTGKLINEMADNITEGVVEGIDFSETMLKHAIKANKVHIAKGKVSLKNVECSNLPFDSETFDKLCSVNTLYFWKEPKKYFNELFRVINHGGKIVIGFRDRNQLNNLPLNLDTFNTYSQDDVVKILLDAGFSDAHIVEKEGIPFISYCAVATKA